MNTSHNQANINKLIMVVLDHYDQTVANGYAINEWSSSGVVVGIVVLETVADAWKFCKQGLIK